MSMIRRRTRMTKKKKKNIKYELVREELHFNICQLFLLRWISLNRFVCLAPINRSSRTGTAHHHLHLGMMQRKMQHSTHFEAVDWTLLERRFSQNNIFSKPCKLTNRRRNIRKDRAKNSLNCTKRTFKRFPLKLSAYFASYFRFSQINNTIPGPINRHFGIISLERIWWRNWRNGRKALGHCHCPVTVLWNFRRWSGGGREKVGNPVWWITKSCLGQPFKHSAH